MNNTTALFILISHLAQFENLELNIRTRNRTFQKWKLATKCRDSTTEYPVNIEQLCSAHT